MTSEQTEQAIRQTIATEVSAAALADRLFAPDGLFSSLAGTADERRILVQTPLFREAQKRFRELQQQEAARFMETVRQAKVTSYAVKAER
jgi:hypothetical protein